MVLDMYLPTYSMEEVTNISNHYVEKRKLLELNLQIWYQKHMSVPFDIKSFFRLLALMLYMGIFCLPCKKDYWKYDIIYPYQPIMYEMVMSQYWIAFMWRHFNISVVDLLDIRN